MRNWKDGKANKWSALILPNKKCSSKPWMIRPVGNSVLGRTFTGYNNMQKMAFFSMGSKLHNLLAENADDFENKMNSSFQ